FWPAARFCGRFPVTGDFQHLHFLENGGVKFDGLFGIVIEPEEWGDFLHVLFWLRLRGLILGFRMFLRDKTCVGLLIPMATSGHRGLWAISPGRERPRER